jgi:tRNA nucleotidyltransferase/poly(A) polymerase
MINIWQVGGSVRDEILGVKPKDYDYAVEADSWEDMVNYISQHGKIYLQTPEYFTVRAHMDKLGDADFVLCRKDGKYKDGRHPESVDVGTIHDDLARRDFTMNAIARNTETGLIYDPFNGQLDIQHRILRCVGNAFDRFNEDGLRVLRALRFIITKNLRFDDILLQIMDADFTAEWLRNVSLDRKRDELMKMLKFDTITTLEYLQLYPKIRNILFEDNVLWLKPTNEQ